VEGDVYNCVDEERKGRLVLGKRGPFYAPSPRMVIADSGLGISRIHERRDSRTN